jgi:Protein of unknown function (DUF2934)
MVAAGQSWSSIQAATGCSCATIAKIAKRVLRSQHAFSRPILGPSFWSQKATCKPKFILSLLTGPCQGAPGKGATVMQDDLEQSIRERAYHLWIEGGCQDGHADTHWLAAQREVLGVFLGAIGRVTLNEPPLAQTSEKPKKIKKARIRRPAA